ncbi:DUF2625 domain-containing protein [Intrasporangium calvum]|uniref:DUF2625 domain-containing protein n=1 Tax=Intrasporangium calvum TaxID=53358 RepID=A0ABT5GG92_9MICO|nr:DUF2625 family protein [Intrasporangium calvum]MDC5697280.1 DUF2625 domain-containing protein [Intrasporangium calvum]
MGSVRDITELVNEDDSVWQELRKAVAGSETTVLPRDDTRAAATLFRLQVSTRSTLGALAYNAGGLVVDHGWLRILGGGTDRLVGLADINTLGEPRETSTPPGHLVVAQDILGGYFAINGGDLPVDLGEIAYWGPDTLDWSGLGAGHTAFVHWAISGGTTDFYRDLRWDGWQDVAASLQLDEGLSLYPPPSTVEGQDISSAYKQAVPMTQLVAFHADFAKATDGQDGPFVVRVAE